MMLQLDGFTDSMMIIDTSSIGPTIEIGVSTLGSMSGRCDKRQHASSERLRTDNMPALNDCLQTTCQL